MSQSAIPSAPDDTLLVSSGIRVDLPLNPDEQAKLDNWFSYHRPDDKQQAAYVAIRDAGKVFAEVIMKCTPRSADQTVAVRHIRDAVMNANASIACGGK